MSDTTAQKKGIVSCSHDGLDNENKMETTPEESSSNCLGHKEIETNDNEGEGLHCDDNEGNGNKGEGLHCDENDMDNLSIDCSQEFDIVLHVKMIKELKLMRTDLEVLRLDNMIIKEELRTNQQLTKLLWDTLNTTDTQIRSPATSQLAEDSIIDELSDI